MDEPRKTALLREIADGRTDLIVELLAAGSPPDTATTDGVPLISHCAYYGDTTAIRLLLAHGATLAPLGRNLGLNGAVFHGHWQLCLFLLQRGADANEALPSTGETPLHAATCKTDRVIYDPVVKILLAHGADPNRATIPAAASGGFMRDARTRGETPLHRAAAFGGEHTIRMLLDAGARLDARDAHGDSPLSWGSWALRPRAILRMLCFGDFRIDQGSKEMRENLVGFPHPLA